jgi:long-chain acyl-CoA synthetase
MEITRTFDLLDNLIQQHPHKKDALASKVGGKWRLFSVQEYADTVRLLSYGFLALKVLKGEKIATVTNNRPEWNFVDMAVSQVGAVHVPIYPTISDDQYRHILAHSESRFLFVQGRDLYERLKPIADEIGTLEKVFTFDKLDDAPHWSELVELGTSSEDYLIRGTLVNRRNETLRGDVATIIYTSGTTGIPKGVALTHWNFVYQLFEISKLLDLKESDKALSFLPLCHVLERIGGYIYLFRGVGVYYAESTETIGVDVKEVCPTIMITVPRLLEKIYDKILQKGKDLTGVKRRLFHWAVDLGLQFEVRGKGLKYMANLAIARKLIFTKWQAALGGNMRYIIAGGAALQPRLARVFWAAGIPVYEGYGLTETSPVSAVNSPGNNCWPCTRGRRGENC